MHLIRSDDTQLFFYPRILTYSITRSSGN